MAKYIPDRASEGVLFQNQSTADDCFKLYGIKDPFPDIQPALLNSADIYDYIAETGMIAPFYPASLKPASYEASLLGSLIWWDENKETPL
jgi:hypothetical protein